MDHANRAPDVAAKFGMLIRWGFLVSLLGSSSGCFSQQSNFIGVKSDALTASGPATLRFTLLPGVITAQDTAPFALLALDSKGKPIPGAPISVSANNGEQINGSTNAAGIFQSKFPNFTTKAGAYTLTAQLSGLGSPSVTENFRVLSGPLASFVLSPLSVSAGATLTAPVSAVDAWGNPVSGVALQGTSGSFGASATTDAQGHATLTFATFYTQTGTFPFQVAATSFPVASSTQVAVTAGSPVKLVFLSQPQGAIAGAKLPAFTIGAQDAYGNAANIAGTSTCALALASGSATGPIGGTFSGVTPNSTGGATFSNVSFSKIGTYLVTAQCTGIASASSASSSFTISVGSASVVATTGTVPSSVNGSQPFNVSVLVTDAQGNPVSSGSVAVALASGPSGGSLAGPTSASVGSNGVATFTGLSVLAITSGTYNLSFTTGSANAATLALSVTAMPIVSSFTATPAATTVGNTVTLAWSTVATTSVSISGVSTTFSGATGSIQVSPAGNTTYTLSARNATGGTTTASVGVTVSQKAIASLGFVSLPGSAQAGSALASFKVQALDSTGAPVPMADGIPCALTVASGPSTGTPSGLKATTSGGVATFNQVALQSAGIYTLGANCSGVATGTSQSFAVTAGPPSVVTITASPPSALTTQQTFSVSAYVADTYGNPETSGTANIAIGTTPAGATLQGTTSLAINNGTVTFSGLSISAATNGNYSLSVSSGSTNTNSSEIAVTVVPSTLVFATQPPAAIAGATVASFSLQGQIASGAVVPIPAGTQCSLVFSTKPTTALLPSAGTSVSATNGVATFDQIVLEVAGTYAFSASCGGLNAPAVVSNSFVITAGPLSMLSLTVPPPTGLSNGETFGATVAGMDAYANPVAANGSVSVSILTSESTAGFTLSGNPYQTFNAGVATFSGLSVSLTTLGTLTLAFQSGALSVNSAAIQYSPIPPVGGRYVPLPQSLASYQSLPSNGVNAIAFSGNTFYYATNGGLGISTDGGKTFSVKTTAQGLPDTKVTGVVALGQTVVTYGSGVRTLAVSQDGGNSFHVAQEFEASTIAQVVASGSSIYVLSYVSGLVGTDNPTYVLSRSTDGGSTFPTLQSPAAYRALYFIGSDECGQMGSNANPLYAASDGTLYLSGTSMQTVPAYQYQCPAGLSVSKDGGKTFAAVPGLPATALPMQVYASGQSLYVALSPYLDGTGGGIWISHDGGTTFSVNGPASGLGSPGVLNFTVSNGTIYAATYPTTVYTAGGGGTDPIDPTPTSPASDGGGVSVSTDGGQTYTNFGMGQGLPANKILGVATVEGLLFAWGNYSTEAAAWLDVSADQGKSFTSVSDYSNFPSVRVINGQPYLFNSTGVQILSPTTGQVVESILAVNSPDYNSSSLTVLANGYFLANLYGEGASCNTTLSTCIPSTGVGKKLGSSNAEISDTFSFNNQIYALWQGTLLQPPATDAYGDTITNGNILAVSVSTDGGQTFTDTGWSMAAPAYDEGSLFAETLFFGSDQGTLYIVADKIGIFASSNGGNSFTKLPAFPAVTYSAFYASGNSIYAIAANANANTSYSSWASQLAISTDGGQTRKTGPAVSYSFVDIAQLNGTLYLIDNFMETLYATTDNGNTFSLVPTPMLLNQLTAYNGTLFFNGGSIYSKDGGKSFYYLAGADSSMEPVFQNGYIYTAMSAGQSYNLASGTPVLVNPVVFKAPLP